MLEIFKDGGLETLSGRIYIDDGDKATGIALYARNAGTVTASVTVYTMDTVWKPATQSAVRNFTDSLYNLLDALVDV